MTSHEDAVLRHLLAGEEEPEQALIRASQSPTLLPAPLASTVSLVTATSSIGLRLGGFLGNAAINAARVGTLTGFEIGRVVFEGILTRAGQDVVNSSSGDGGRAYFEKLIRTSLLALHHSITSTAFLVSAGFQIGSTSLSSGIATAQLLLSALDSILGDTQTSRAVMTIIALAQREFRNPQTGVSHQRVSLWDIFVGTVAFAILQRWGEKRTQQELEAERVQELVWDLVVIAEEREEDNARALMEEDVGEDGNAGFPFPNTLQRATSFVSATGTGETFEALGDGRSFVSVATTPAGTLGHSRHPSEHAFRHAISSQLSPGARVSLAVESLIQDTVVVDVSGDSIYEPVEPPAGFVMVARESQPRPDGSVRLTFQRKRKKRRHAVFTAEESSADRPLSLSIDDNSTSTVPASPQDEFGGHVDGNTADAYATRRPQDLPPAATSCDGGAKDDDESDMPILANQKRHRMPLPGRQSPDSKNERRSKSTTPPSSSHRGAVGDQIGEIAATPVRKAMQKGKSVRKLVDFWSKDKLKRMERQDGHQRIYQPDMLGLGNSSRDAQPRYLSQTIQPLSQISATPLTEAALLQQRPPQTSSHRRSHSAVSISSETSLVPYVRLGDEDRPVASRLYRDGYLAGHFPKGQLVHHLTRFAKFSIAAYGATFLRLTNSWQNDSDAAFASDHLPQHHTFSSYIRLPSSSVLLSSYNDPEGGSNAAGDSEPGLPLVHYISVDHESKAIVLTCRGTLGFEDVLTDLTGDYDDIVWQGKTYQVHRGILATARRLLTIHGGRVVATLKAALDEFPEYGLVLCGHSLGGSVAAALAVLLSQPNTTSAGGAYKFVTAPVQHSKHTWLCLPAHRPIHAFAYGPAACFSSSLQLATRGLITSILHGNDALPFLSLGTLIDFQAMAHSFATDSHNAKGEILRRIRQAMYNAFRDRTGLGIFNGTFDSSYPSTEQMDEDDDDWPWIALKVMRASMLADKLGPPGEVFTIESQAVLQRHAFVEPMSSKDRRSEAEMKGYRPARQVKFKHVLNVERHFSELRFGASMFLDHFPGKYEEVLATLDRGLGGREGE